MMMNDIFKINEILLVAFVDGELDAVDHQAIVKAMHNDENLRNQVCNLQKIKGLMKQGFSEVI